MRVRAGVGHPSGTPVSPLGLSLHLPLLSYVASAEALTTKLVHASKRPFTLAVASKVTRPPLGTCSQSNQSIGHSCSLHSGVVYMPHTGACRQWLWLVPVLAQQLRRVGGGTVLYPGRAPAWWVMT